MDSLRDFLNCSNVAKLSRRATSDLIDNLLELDTAIEKSAFTDISKIDLLETYRLLDESCLVESSVQPFVCALRNGLREYLAPMGLLGDRSSHGDRTYELSRQNSVMRNISKSLVDKPEPKTKAELSATKEESLDRTVDLLIINSYRKRLTK
jgi:hypothetical protein